MWAYFSSAVIINHFINFCNSLIQTICYNETVTKCHGLKETMINNQLAFDFLVTLLPELGAELLRLQAEKNFAAHDKKADHPASIVTKADLFADQFLTGKLKAKFPTSNFLTEETTSNDDLDKHDFTAYLQLPDLWIIDPIDGTANFARGSEDFMVSIALAQRGVINLAVTFRPATRELFFAKRGKGAWLLSTTNERVPLQVSTVASLGQSAISFHLGPTIKAALHGKGSAYRWAELFKNSKFMVRDVGSLVLTGVRIARGHYDAWLGARIAPWDWAAVSLLIEQVGGKVTTLDGEEWNFAEPSGLFSNGLLHQEILDALKK
jgi:myo-inositol-1(or 4)-monophosphatase